MSSLARTERAQLCDTALAVGEGGPTLCGEWTVKDLVVHLLVRERDLTGMPGILVPALEGLTQAAERRTGRDDFEALVRRLREGPPAYSPMRWRPVDSAVNTLEYFIHHEDIRRARPRWRARSLSAADEAAIWAPLALVGRLLMRRSPVGVVVERTDVDSRHCFRGGDEAVVVRGLPSEIALFLYGRQQHSLVDVTGESEHVAALVGAQLGP